VKPQKVFRSFALTLHHVFITETTKGTTARADVPIPSHHGVGCAVSRVHRLWTSVNAEQGIRLQDVDIRLDIQSKHNVLLGENHSL
jgi:hypothetical protein